MAVRIEFRHDDAACSSCGAGTVVASALRPEYVDPLPHDGDADLAAEVAALEAELHGLLDGIAPVGWWVKRKKRQEKFTRTLAAIVTDMKEQTARPNTGPHS